ncbi:class I SAM-dependent methyltransferase [Streptomyces sp. CA-249302]|uniref:class I SAM-dependent methyltransferase n=1 Tax=Streptomyces sp. CA-249302 TaxID=3240058 RepID=UPI003D8D6726
MADTGARDGLSDREAILWIADSQQYDRTFQELREHTVDALLDAAGVAEGAYVLDVGAGKAARAAVERGARVRAVGTDPLAIMHARGGGVDAIRHALPQLPYGDGEFDMVLANFVLDHVERPRTSLAELRRVLRPGGRIALTLWSERRGAGQDLLPRACAAGGVVLPPDRLDRDAPSDPPPLDPAEDFVRTPAGVLELLDGTGFAQAEAAEVAWSHETRVEWWWGGLGTRLYLRPAYVTPPDQETTARIRAEYDRLRTEFAQGDGNLLLPHIALLASATAA